MPNLVAYSLRASRQRTRSYGVLLLVLLFCWGPLAPAFSKQNSVPKVVVSGEITFAKDGHPQINGTMTIKGWPNEGENNEKCLYLPYQDAAYGSQWQINQHLKMIGKKNATRHLFGGHMAIKGAVPIGGGGSIVSIVRAPKGALQLHFNAKAPARGRPSKHDFFFDDFLPVPLKSCPKKGESPVIGRRFSALLYSGSIKGPDGWQMITRLSEKGVLSSKISLAIIRNYFKKTFEIDGVYLHLYYRDHPFARLKSTFKTALQFYTKWLGKLPYKNLYILESSELQSFSMEGMIAINRSRQSLFKSLQGEWLNWSHWAATTLLAYQWYIPQLLATTQDDLWFFQGLVDFLTDLSLRENATRYNLFNSYDLGFSVLSMDYKDVQNLTAALLEKYAPLAKLTTENYTSKTPFESQHPLLFIRHTMSLRHLLTSIGERGFQSILANLKKTMQDKPFKPRQFVEAINKMPSPFSAIMRKRLTNYVKQWWTLSGFPDYTLKEVKAKELESGKFLVDISLEGKNFPFPVPVKVTDIAGGHKMSLAKPLKNTNQLETSIITHFEPLNVEIDPDRHIYDRNRFDNSDRGVDVQFFPGSAASLKDDAYTVVWLPYMQRRPGEDFAVGFQANLFKYVSGQLLLGIERQHDGKTGFSILKKDKFPSYALGLEGLIRQDFQGFRESRLVLKRSPIFDFLPGLSLSGKVRERRIVGQKKTAHGTVALSSTLMPGLQKQGCTMALKAEMEVAPKSVSPSFTYKRQTSHMKFMCFLGKRSAFSLRLFRGALAAKDEVPGNILFKPTNLSESKIRLVMPGVPLVHKIVSLSSDLYLPFYLPLPSDSLVLSRQLKWRIFYDFGKAREPDATLAGGGIGVLMPFGGDFIGVGSLALTRFSLMAVLYSRVSEDVRYEPAILFDITGSL